MGDWAIFTVGMMLLGPVVILIVGLIGSMTVRGIARGGASAATARWGCGLVGLTAICGFCGVMVASAGGALHPPLVTVAAPYVCDGTVETQSRNYSYKPGQQGVARNIFCLDPDGGRRDITLRAAGAAAVYYTLIFLVAGLVLVFLVRLLKPRRSADAQSDIVADFGKRMAERLRTDADIVRRPAAPPVTGGGVEDRLRHLQSLRDGGLISEEEYQAKRTEILAGL
ncbi:SHOCT domain-containing protein [Sphingopyxis sp. 550A]